MPPRSLFVSAEEYSATLLHELAHYADFRIMLRSSRGLSEGVQFRHGISE
jgi:antirestriction protein ArdC